MSNCALTYHRENVTLNYIGTFTRTVLSRAMSYHMLSRRNPNAPQDHIQSYPDQAPLPKVKCRYVATREVSTHRSRSIAICTQSMAREALPRKARMPDASARFAPALGFRNGLCVLLRFLPRNASVGFYFYYFLKVSSKTFWTNFKSGNGHIKSPESRDKK